MFSTRRLTVLIAIMSLIGLIAAPAVLADDAADTSPEDELPDVEGIEITYDESGTVVTDENIVLNDIDVDADAVGIYVEYDGEVVYNETHPAHHDLSGEVLVDDGGLFGIGSGGEVDIYVTVTDDDGNYQVYATTHEWGDESPTTTEDLSLIDRSLSDVSIDLEDGSGNPIADATVELGDEVASSTALGSVEFTDVLMGDYDVVADAEGYEPASHDLTVGGDESMTLTLEESPTYTLAVDVVDPDGDPLEADVTVDGETQTGDGVEFELEDGEYVVTTEADGYATGEETVVIDGQDESATVALEDASDGSGSDDGAENGDGGTGGSDDGGDGTDGSGSDDAGDADDGSDDGDETASSADESSALPISSGLLGILGILLAALLLVLFLARGLGGAEESDETEMVRYD